MARAMPTKRKRSPESTAALQELTKKYTTSARNAQQMADMAKKDKLSTSYVMQNEANRRKTYAKKAKSMSEE